MDRYLRSTPAHSLTFSEKIAKAIAQVDDGSTTINGAANLIGISRNSIKTLAIRPQFIIKLPMLTTFLQF
jgi:hypothetical protein